ncbi:MAG: hypothetical protein DHS20C16_30490 [Phycisphaerae bacterium]|nr:MAG: hypothetical protein DHS20C16_30490 [Phycisphaerae bacterium]
MNVTLSFADRLRQMASVFVFALGLLGLWLTASCTDIEVFDIDCPETVELDSSMNIRVNLSSNDSTFSFTVEELDGAQVETRLIEAESDKSTGFVNVKGEALGSTVIVVTEIASDGIQLGVPLECTIEIVEPQAVDCEVAGAADGLGDSCTDDSDCNECQVCLMVSSVPSSTCAIKIPCESSLDCQAASMGDQFSVNFCGDDGFCR